MMEIIIQYQLKKQLDIHTKMKMTILIFLCLLAPLSSFSDTFLFADGSTMEGELISQDENEVSVKIPYGTIQMRWHELSYETKSRINPDLFPVQNLDSLIQDENFAENDIPEKEEKPQESKKQKEEAQEEPLEIPSKPLHVTTKDRRIYVNGRLYFIKGICYGTFYPGKGFTKHAYRQFPEDLKQKDFQMMKEAGFNTIRLYENMPDDFYDNAFRYGLKVIEPVMYPNWYTNVDNPDVFNDLKEAAIQRVREMKDHPAILMWTMWNDAPFHKTNIVKKFGDKKVNDFFKKIYDEIKKIDKNHPVTGANMINVKNGWNMGFFFLDVIGCNSYIGLDHDEKAWKESLFSREQGRKRVKAMKAFSIKLNKPVFITETGCSTHVKYSQQGKVIAHQLAIVGERLAGYCIFEWTDEWWKADKNQTQEQEIEEHWGICDAYRKPKPAYHVIKKFFTVIPTESKGLNQKYLEIILGKKENQESIVNGLVK
ncbi:MAG: hypothetical protein JW928_01195 [Candidatus Aureabacteria bacterium]|nr:hypothetical protein [Candidatus Auribacterota bacterium]